MFPEQRLTADFRKIYNKQQKKEDCDTYNKY